jgi:predicted O-linked N-acetylglucosamine transferase (SPINDLY family)
VSVPAGGSPLRLGCACVPAKLNARSLEVFGSVLAALPGATLTFVGFRSRRGAERVRSAFGEAASRVACLPRLAPAQYLAEIATWDLALDTVGFSGGTSTLDALWQGVPVVTWPLVLSHTRSSASLLAGLGETECIAADAHAYVAAALRTIEADRARPERRVDRRRRMQACSLGDPAKFAPHFYAAALERAAATREPLPA